MSFVESIRLLAMQAVLDSDPDYQLRSVLRWYSREFHTPLSEVYDIPIDEVIEAFYECKYEDMDDGQRNFEIGELLKTNQAVVEAKKKEDADEVDDVAFLQKVMEEAKSVVIPKPEPQKPIEAPPDISMSFDSNLDIDALDRDSMTPPPKKKR